MLEELIRRRERRRADGRDIHIDDDINMSALGSRASRRRRSPRVRRSEFSWELEKPKEPSVELQGARWKPT
eukprot:1097111-Pyramimonas_sp.AAC.1